MLLKHHFFELLKLMFLFSIIIDPELGLSIKDSKFNKVDLPDPDGPINE